MEPDCELQPSRGRVGLSDPVVRMEGHRSTDKAALGMGQAYSPRVHIDGEVCTDVGRRILGL